MLKKHLLFILCFAIFAFTASAQPQSKDELKKQQQQLEKEIADLTRMLATIQKNRKRSLGELTAVKRKIEAREALVNSINREMKQIDDNIYLTNLDVYRLNKELEVQKQQYAQSLVFAYKNRSNYDYLNFIFSANSFNDAIKRVTYLKSYRRQRETQVSSILKTQEVLKQKIAALNSNKTDKNLALEQQTKQIRELENDKKEKDKVVSSLKGQEKELASTIKKKDRERRELASAIQAIIRREMAAAKKRDEEARKAAAANAAKNNTTAAPKRNTTAKEPVGNAATAGGKRGSIESLPSVTEGETIVFENSKGRLPWPVDAGFVSIPFGSYELPGTKLKGISDGIEISVNAGATVKAVAEGEVASVFDLGGEQAVVIRHGKYFTTYSHLASVNLSRGQQIKAGAVVGRAASDESGGGMVLFMVSNEKGAPLNPMTWLRKR